MPRFNKYFIAVTAILIVAAGLRLFGLGQADVIGDESINAFRALGYIDFFAEQGQETILNWFDQLPWWTVLSFHDHPLLSFLFNSLFLNLLGPTAVAVRLVSALAGIISVWLMYLLGRELLNHRAGLIAAGLLAANSFMVWLSRVGLQESLLLSLILGSLYCFLRARNQRGYLYAAAALFGLAVLTKYTAVVLLPVIIFLVIRHRVHWRRGKTWYLSMLLFLVLLTPIIIYNVNLFAARGHFDLQLSYVTGLADKVPGWVDLPGKSDLSISQRILSLPNEFGKYASPFFIMAAIAGVIFSLSRIRALNPAATVGGIWLLSTLAIIAVVGPQPRFAAMLVAPLIILAAGFFDWLFEQKKFFFVSLALTVVVLLGELFYSVNTFFIQFPAGNFWLTHSAALDRDRRHWGFNQLDQYLNEQLGDKVSALRFAFAHPYLEQRLSENVESRTGQEAAVLLIYDFNIKDGPDMWYLRRREFYDGWPLVTANIFVDTLEKNGPDFYFNQGFTTFYFIQPTVNTLVRPPEQRTDVGQQLGASLLESGVTPTEIYNLDVELSFLVYQF